MNKKVLVIIALVALLIPMYMAMHAKEKEDVVVFTANALMPEMSLDDIIRSSDLILVGDVVTTLPSQWRRSDEKKIIDATPDEIFQAGGLFTDSIISINQILKGDNKGNTIRVRSFIGETNNVSWVDENEESFLKGKSYLLFLSENYGPSAHIEPGSYISVNSFEGVYEIEGGKAFSGNDKWLLDDLLSHVQEILLTEPILDIPETPEVKEIMRRVEVAYDIEAEASYSFDLSKFPTIFISDSRFSVNPDVLEFVRMATDNPLLERTGYLDYKIAYYTWWKDGVSLSDEIRARAEAENRNITEEELNTFLATKWANVPGHVVDPIRHFKIKFISVNIDNDVATVVTQIDLKITEMYLVRREEQWYVAGDKDSSIQINAASEAPVELPPIIQETVMPLPEETASPTP